MAAPLKPADPGFFVLRQRLAQFEARQHALIGPERRILGCAEPRVRRGVGEAEKRRRVAGAAGGAGERVEARIEPGTVPDHPVVHLVEPGIERGAGRRTGRAGGVMAGEERALSGEPVDIRGQHRGVADRAQAVAAPLIGGDEEDIGTVRHQAAPVSGR